MAKRFLLPSCTLPPSAFHRVPRALALPCHPLSSLPFLPPRTRRRADPGDWKFSPEWWGTQNRGWGHNEGLTVFRERSDMGNGMVSVTAHPASTSGVEDWPELLRELKQRQSRYRTSGQSCDLEVLGSEWRVLRFNNYTRQSVAKVILVQEQDNVHLLQIPTCLAFEYLKSMVSIGLATVSCAGLDLELVAEGKKQMRTLCIGLGGGSLPLFLVNKMPGCFVEVVDIDRTVISAATEFMGFPECSVGTSVRSVATISLHNSCDSPYSLEGVETMIEPKSQRRFLWGSLQERISTFEADGVAYVYDLFRTVQRMGNPTHRYDLVFIDAFDGNDEVPYCFWSRGGHFLTALRHLLHPTHGTVVMNLHTDMPPPTLLERMTGEFGPGFDPLLPGGSQVQEISRNYRDVLLQFPNAETGKSHSSPALDTNRDTRAAGVAFTLAIPSQQNLCLVVSRGIDGGSDSIKDNLKEKACCVEGMLNIPFDMSRRISRGFTKVK